MRTGLLFIGPTGDDVLHDLPSYYMLAHFQRRFSAMFLPFAWKKTKRKTNVLITEIVCLESLYLLRRCVSFANIYKRGATSFYLAIQPSKRSISF